MPPQTDKAEPLTNEQLDAFPGVMDLLHGLCAVTAPDGPLSREFYRDSSATVIRLCTAITQTQAARDDLLHNIRVLRARAEKAEANQRTPGTVEVCESLRNAGYYGPTCRTGDCPLRAAKDAT